MKKIITILAVTAFVLTGVFAEDAATTDTSNKETRAELANAATPDIATRVLELEDKYPELHPKATNVKLEIEYTPLTGEVNFYYTCMAASYDQGEAMNTAIAMLKDFQADNQYMHYTYRAKDKTKYFKDGRDVKMTTYKSSVIFTR